MLKGQTQVLEMVVIFGLGVVIVGGFIVAFENFGQRVKDEAVDVQMQSFGDLVSSNILLLTQNNINSGRVTFTVPPSIADESYSLNLTDDGVGIYVEDESYVSTNLNGIEERYDLYGYASSEYDTFTLHLNEDDEIRIGGS